MNKRIIILFASLVPAMLTGAQDWQRIRDSLNRISYADHRLMMKQLGISELRPGPSGDPNAPNAANSDESKATKYTSLPDPLVFHDGSKVTTAVQWKERRKELFGDFDMEIYGRLPDHIPAVTWEVLSEKDTLDGEHRVKIKELLGRADNSDFPDISVGIRMTLTTPAGAVSDGEHDSVPEAVVIPPRGPRHQKPHLLVSAFIRVKRT